MKKKIIIISYFFPPGKTPANRTLSWLKFLPEHDIYPIIITKAFDNNVGIEKTIHGEIHRIDAPLIFNERLAKAKLPTILKVLLIKIYHLTIGISKFDKTYTYFNNYFVKNFANEHNLLIITGSPFILFRIGFEYTKNAKNKWIADYRDMWHLSDMPRILENKLEDLLRKYIGLKIEKKWINTTSIISVTTDYFIPKLKTITTKKIITIENGFFENEFINLNTKKNKKLTFVYVGTIYKTQEIDKCILAINEACKQEQYKSEFLFIGSSFSKKMSEFIKNWNNEYVSINTTPKIPKNECLNIQNQSHLGVMCSYGVKGIPSSKLYEFLGMKQPVLLYPSDNDIIEEKLTKSNLGFCYTNHLDAVKGIKKIIDEFKQTNDIKSKPNNKYISLFSRKELAKQFYTKVLKSE